MLSCVFDGVSLDRVLKSFAGSIDNTLGIFSLDLAGISSAEALSTSTNAREKNP